MPEGVEGSGLLPPARTQATLTSYGAEPQTQLPFAGFVLNVGCVNDLWRVTISLDAASMPCRAGSSSRKRRGARAAVRALGDAEGEQDHLGGQNTLIQFNDCHVLDPVAAAWSSPTVNGTPPMVRMKHTASAITPSTLLVFGGFNKTERDGRLLQARPIGRWWQRHMSRRTPKFRPASPSLPARSTPPRSRRMASSSSSLRVRRGEVNE